VVGEGAEVVVVEAKPEMEGATCITSLSSFLSLRMYPLSF